MAVCFFVICKDSGESRKREEGVHECQRTNGVDRKPEVA